MKQIIWKFGLLSGGILLVWVTVAWLLGTDTNPKYFDSGEKVGYTIMVLAMGLVFVAVKQVRDRELGGVLTFGKALTIGTATNLIASTIFGLFNIVYLRFLSPDFLSIYSQHFRQSIVDSTLPQAEMETQLAKLDASKDLFLNPEFNAFIMFATVFLIGLAVTLIAAVVLRKVE